jgi:hypothetical protein
LIFFKERKKERKMSEGFSQTPQIIMPIQYGQLPELSGLSIPPNVFGTTFPQPGPPAINFSTDLPTSPAEAMAKTIKSQAGGSKSMDTVSMNVVTGPWDDYPYHQQILKGQPVFGVVTETGISSILPVMNIRHVNNILREGFEEAVKLWRNRRMIVDGQILTEEEYEILFKTPTSQWKHLEFLNTLLLDKNKADFHNIGYLYEEGCRPSFNFLGFPRTHGNQVEDLVEVSIAHKGSVENAENIFGNEVMGGHRWGFIFTRIINEVTGALGPFAFIPWHGFDRPKLFDSRYIDFNGFERFGKVTEEGSVDRWVSEHTIDPHILKESLGLVPQTSDRYTITPEPGCMRYTLHARRDYRVNFLL